MNREKVSSQKHPLHGSEWFHSSPFYKKHKQGSNLLTAEAVKQ